MRAYGSGADNTGDSSLRGAHQVVWDVYIVETDNGKLYTGITTDLDRRFDEHRGSPRGAKFFRISSPARIVFRERHADRAAATSREREIKRMSRPAKLRLVASRPRSEG